MMMKKNIFPQRARQIIQRKKNVVDWPGKKKKEEKKSKAHQTSHFSVL
jgi:hypothetical protein